METEFLPEEPDGETEGLSLRDEGAERRKEGRVWGVLSGRVCRVWSKFKCS